VRFTLYGREGCHLCEDMERALDVLAAELGFTVTTVDVDFDADAEARYGDRVPVLVDGAQREICYAVLDVEAVRRRLAVK